MENIKIPKIIHYCWFGQGEMTDKEKQWIQSWKIKCPDYDIKLWNETNYDIHKCKYMEEAAKCGKWSFVTDYVRLDVLYQYGGIYFDTDVELLKCFDDLLQYDGFIGFESLDRINSGQAIGAVAGNEIIRDLRDLYDNISFFKADGSMNLIECPQYITSYLDKRGVLINNSRQSIPGMEIFPMDYFCPKNFKTGIMKVTSNTYSIHHFMGAWHSKKEKNIILFMQFTRRILGEKKGDIFLKWFFETKDKLKGR